jgi:hypothetical protein
MQLGFAEEQWRRAERAVFLFAQEDVGDYLASSVAWRSLLAPALRYVNLNGHPVYPAYLSRRFVKKANDLCVLRWHETLQVAESLHDNRRTVMGEARMVFASADNAAAFLANDTLRYEFGSYFIMSRLMPEPRDVWLPTSEGIKTGKGSFLYDNRMDIEEYDRNFCFTKLSRVGRIIVRMAFCCTLKSDLDVGLTADLIVDAERRATILDANMEEALT